VEPLSIDEALMDLREERLMVHKRGGRSCYGGVASYNDCNYDEGS